MPVAEVTTTGLQSAFTIISDLTQGAGSLIQFAITTFPINLGFAAGVAGIVLGIVKKAKRTVR